MAINIDGLFRTRRTLKKKVEDKLGMPSKVCSFNVRSNYSALSRSARDPGDKELIYMSNLF